MRDYSISLIRFVAMLFIVFCHFMQYFGSELAWWFNVGVQIFLCISGFLYGRKGKIENDLKFYKKNFAKILLDYYIVIVPVILIFALFFSDKLSVDLIIKVLLIANTLEGGGHLWYIPYCLLCYLITPFLSRFFYNNSEKKIVVKFFVLSVIAVLITELFFNYFNSAWIVCYILGYCLGIFSTKEKIKFYNLISCLIVVGAVFMNLIQILQDYVLQLGINGITYSLYLRFCNFAHVLLGVALFIVLKRLFGAVFKKGYPKAIEKLCLFSDRYSYDVYLVHQFIIFAPLSLMNVTTITAINIFITLIAIIALAIIVNLVSKLISSSFKKLLKM